MADLILHNYFRSSTSIRVRVALNLKGLDYHYAAYPLLDNAHKTPEYLELNPQGLVPSLQISPDKVLTQSLAIIEYLDEVQPTPSLLPSDAWGRARVRSLALTVACEVHPINNLSVLKTLRKDFGADDDAVARWFSKWVHEAFTALERRLSTETGTGEFCHGSSPGLADICLYAQVINNQRFGVAMDDYPTLRRIFDACCAVDSFARAHPSEQPDAF